MVGPVLCCWKLQELASVAIPSPGVVVVAFQAVRQEKVVVIRVIAKPLILFPAHSAAGHFLVVASAAFAADGGVGTLA